jgi:AMP-binding enzyme/AMP-binding enzyme C-terminal domain/MaoC like domain
VTRPSGWNPPRSACPPPQVGQADADGNGNLLKQSRTAGAAPAGCPANAEGLSIAASSVRLHYEPEAPAGVPHFFVDAALRHPDGTITSGPGQGELLVRGPNVFSRYWNRPEETRTAFDRGWFATGDVVRIHADGWAQVGDRIKDMIISGGENVYPAEVEAAITELPQVAEAAVVGVADPRWGEAGLAFIVPVPGDPVTENEIRAYLARYKIPREFRFTDVLPRNASGKLLRHQLRAQSDGPAHTRRAPTMTTTVQYPKDFLACAGQNLGISSWLEVPQSDINLFAEATHDHQWIHTDPERSKGGPFGGPIAHGYLTLSLLIPGQKSSSSPTAAWPSTTD